MKIEIDQSGKIEATAQITVVADSIGDGVEISGKTKRHLLSLFRAKGETNMFFVKTFALLVALTIQQSAQKSNHYLIDTEYMGWDATIKTWIFRYLKRLNCNLDKSQLTFGFVGKNSRAHVNAYNIYKRIKNTRQIKCVSESRLLQFLP